MDSLPEDKGEEEGGHLRFRDETLEQLAKAAADYGCIVVPMAVRAEGVGERADAQRTWSAGAFRRAELYFVEVVAKSRRW